jgi:hypothetical protein
MIASTGSYMLTSTCRPGPERASRDQHAAIAPMTPANAVSVSPIATDASLAGHVREPGVGLGERAGTGTVGVRTAAAIRAHAHDDEPIVQRLELREVASPARPHGLGQVLDEHVGRAHERRERPPVVTVVTVGIQVEGDGALVATDRLPRDGAPIPALPHRAHRIAGGRLDLDDVGAEVGQHRRDLRCREHRRDLEDAQPRERPQVGVGHARVNL